MRLFLKYIYPLALCLAGTQSCREEVKTLAPRLTATAITAITYNSAKGGGTITDDGGAAVTGRGVCFSLTAAPPTVDNDKTSDGSGKGAFISTLTNLNPGTTYYLRAYAANSAGTSYGSEISFTTGNAPEIPIVSTSAVSGISETTATCGGIISNDGGVGLLARGVCWSTSPSPTVANDFTTDGFGFGDYVSSLTNLTPATIYYVRAYATNEVGTAYGIEVSFTTN